MRDFKRVNCCRNIQIQTEAPEGVDFDWDLSDRKDAETQVVITVDSGHRTYTLKPLFKLN
jgi:hypothetical protein